MAMCGTDPIEQVTLKAGRTVRVYIGPGKLNSTNTEAEVRELLIRGVFEFDAVCGLNFEISDRSAGSDIRVEYNANFSALGRAWSGGRIQLNSERFLGDLSNRRVAQALICHEMGHVLGLRHDSSDRSAIMHPHLGYHWSVDEVLKLQRRWGPPETPFHPTDRIEMGQKLRKAASLFDSADAAFRSRADARNRFAELGRWDDVRRVNPAVAKALALRDERGQQVAQYHREWWAINKKWNTSGVDGLVRLGL